MPDVPTYGEPRVQQAGIANVRLGAQTSLEDFGGGQAAQQMTQAMGSVAQTAQDIAGQEKQKADQLAFMSADRQASDLQTTIQTNISKNFLGKDALGAQDYANMQMSDGLKKIQDGLSNDAQRMAFARSISQRSQELNKFTQFHVAGEIQKFDDNETSSYLQSSRNAAVQNAHDPDQVNLELQRQTLALQDWAGRKGLQDSEAYKAKLQEQTSGTVSAVIQAQLDKDDPNNVANAKATLAAHKDQLDGQNLVAVQKAIDNAETTSIGLQSWQTMKDWKLADGTPDLARMQNAVYARTDLSDARKVELNAFVKGLAKEGVMEKYQQDAARERSFGDAVIQARQQGQSMPDALKLVQKFGTDPYDQAQKTAFVQKTYAPPEASDPHTYVNLMQQIQGGTASKDQLEQAFQKNQINTSDYRNLSEAFYKSNTEGKNMPMEETWKRVQSLAESQLGNKPDRDNFMYVLHTQSPGLSPDDVWKMANDKLKGTPGGGFLGIFDGPAQYKTDLQKMDAQNIAWGKVHEDVGQDQAKAIGQGVLYAGSPTWGLNDVNSFAEQFGGYDNIKRGTPVNNAIESLRSQGKLVTPANVKTVLAAHPDGKYTGGFKQ